MAQTRASPTLSRGFTRLGRFLAPYGIVQTSKTRLINHRGNPDAGSLRGPDQIVNSVAFVITLAVIAMT